MENKRVIICDSLSPSGVELLAQQVQVDNRAGISPEELAEVIGQYHGLIVRSRTKMTADLIALANNLEIIGRAGVGVDNIDLAAAQAKGVAVVNSPTATTVAVAEHTLALLLSLARHIPRATQSMKQGQWEKKQLQGTELFGKTLGIIGIGRIGSEVAIRAAAFGMRVIAYDIPGREAPTDLDIPIVDLETLFEQADIISIHTPLTKDTRNMIDAEAIAKMRPGVRLVCDARGGIIDEEALLAALVSGHVAGAALDVFATEPPGITPLIAHPNVIVSPHLGAQTEEAQERAALHIAEEFISKFSGQPLRWQIV